MPPHSSFMLPLSLQATPRLASLRQHGKPQIGLSPPPDGWDTDSQPTAEKLAARYLFQHRLGQGGAGTIGLTAF